MPMDLPVAGARAGWDGVGRWFGSGRSEGRQGCGQPQRRWRRCVRRRQRSTGGSPGGHLPRVAMACWCQSGAVDRRCGRCRDRRVKPLPGVRHNSRQCQRLPARTRPERCRRSAHQRRMQAAAGHNPWARACGSLPIARGTAWRRGRSGLQRPSALHSTGHPAAVQPCSHAVMPRGERPPGRALRAVNNARATSVPPPPLWAAVAMLPRGISPRGRRAPRCRRSRA